MYVQSYPFKQMHATTPCSQRPTAKTDKMYTNGAYCIAEALKCIGVNVIFGVVGIPIVEASSAPSRTIMAKMR